MNTHIKINQKVMPLLLLVVFLLESCYNSNIATIVNSTLNIQSKNKIKAPPNCLSVREVNASSSTVEDNPETNGTVSITESFLIQQTNIYNQELNKYFDSITTSTYQSPTKQADTVVIIIDKHIIKGNKTANNYTNTLTNANYNKSTIANKTLTLRKKYLSSNPVKKKKKTNKIPINSSIEKQQSLLARQKDSIATTAVRQPLSISHHIITLLESKVCITRDGYQVTFEKIQEGGLQAIVEQNFSAGFTRQILPVITELGFDFSQAVIQNSAWQKAYIHILKECVYVGTMGLKGGGPGTGNSKVKTIFSGSNLQVTLKTRKITILPNYNTVIGYTKLNPAPTKPFNSSPHTSFHYPQSHLYYLAPDTQIRRLSKYQEKHEFTAPQVENEKTLELYIKQAEQGDPEAQFKLGTMYESGRGIAQNLTKAVGWLQNAALQNHAEAQFRLGTMYESGRGIAQNLTKAVEWYQNAALQNHVEAQFKLGLIYESGQCVSKDDIKALEWYQEAANQGLSKAQSNLGKMYEGGRGVVAKDDTKAVEWYQKSADQGDAKVQFKLATMYETGQGVIKDDTKAVEWYQKSADQGDAKVQFKLATMYESGQGVIKDNTKAVEWYQKSADQGNAKAQSNLATMYETGQGIGKDFTKAVEWYQKAANQGYLKAQLKLAIIYENGQGVDKDDTKAAEYYRKAAIQGNSEAQFKLATMYETGRGVDKDNNNAIAWYKKAANQEHALAQIKLDTMHIKHK